MSLPSSQQSASASSHPPADSSRSREEKRSYDAVVVGSGQGAGPLATAFAKAGRRTVLIESSHLGGCCVNEGCTPTKTMIASGRVAYLARRAAKDYGVHASAATNDQGSVKVDMQKVRQRKRDIVEKFRGGSERRLGAVEGLDVLMGSARFVAEKQLEVSLNEGGTVDVGGEIVVISTGERPVKPALPGLEGIDPTRLLDSTSVQELGEVPEHLLVLGGGYIGLEFGQLFRRLGARVTIVQRGKQLLPREDPDIAQAMLEILTQDGITVHLQATAIAISHGADAPVTLAFKSSDGAAQEVSGSHVLFAAGRTPNTESLNLPVTGVQTTPKGHVVTSPDLATSVAGIYAIGDVKGGPAFTHIAYDDFRILQHNLITRANDASAAAPTTVEARRAGKVPYVVYTDPQLGHVGLHEAEARALQPPRPNIKVAKMPMAYVARALETDETRGVMKAVVDGDTGEILGFTCLGVEGGEIMSVVQMAMLGGLKHWDLQAAVFAHPTFAESLNNLWGFLE